MTSPQPSLLERVRGPNARPIEMLVQRGTATAERIAGRYQDFARLRVEEVARRLAAVSHQAPDKDWQTLHDMIQDLRSSSATCGSQPVARVAASWERALDPQYRKEPRLMAVMQLHMDALRLAVSDNAGGDALKALGARLDSVVASLNPTA